MLAFIIRPRVAALAAAVLAVFAAPVSAQVGTLPNSATLVNPAFRVNPNLTLQQAAFNTAVTGRALAQIPPYLYGYNPYPSAVSVYGSNPTFNPNLGYGTLANSYLSTGAGYGGYGGGYSDPYSYGWDPWGGSLRGVADIVGAQGRFAVSMEQSRLTREQRRQAEVDTRRKIFDEWQYERANTPTLEDIREQDKKLQRRRALNDPPITEILSGTALNTLLDHLNMLQRGGAKGPNVALDEETLQHVNVTSGSGGNVGILKNAGHLNWPLALRADEYKTQREEIDRDLPKLVEKAEFGNPVDAGSLLTIKKNVEKLHDKLAENVGEIGTGQYIESKRFLNFLNDGLRALGNDDVGNYFSHKFAAKGKTVAELVKYMSDKGLKFAPAMSGDADVAAYRALHSALAVYDVSLTQNVVEREK
jgi:hypothetical protein